MDFNYAVLKGEPLSYYAYGQYGMRNSSDIDILIDRCNMEKMDILLKKSGYTCKPLRREDAITLFMYSHQYIPWYKTLGNGIVVIIDINIDIFWGEYNGKRIKINDLLSNYIEQDIYKTKIKTLSIYDTFVQLVLHHYKEMNSIYILSWQNAIHYEILIDIYKLLQNNKNELTVNKIYDISNKYNIKKYVYYILYYTNALYRDPELEPYLEALYSTEGAKLIDCYGLSEEEQRQWKYPFTERLNNNKLFDCIKDDLTYKDFEKIKRNNYLFN